MTQPHITLEHAFLYVRDLDRTLAFYRRLLPGWDLRWQGRGQAGHRWVHFGPPGGGQPGYLSLYEEPEARPPAGGAPTLRVAHIGFAHPDVAGAVARLRADAIEPTDEIVDGGFVRAYFDDPDGHELELVQALAPAA